MVNLTPPSSSCSMPSTTHVLTRDCEAARPPLAPNLQYDCSMKTLLVVIAVSSVAFAQSATSGANANPLSAGAKYMYNLTKQNLLKSAQEMPEANYSFKPVDTVRSFGQIVGHLADAQYEFCASVVGDGKQPPGIEKSKTTKADLIQALQDGFAYSDQAYNSMTDALNNFREGKRLTAIMGGHQLERAAPAYASVVRMAKTLAEGGYVVTSGGGPGAMEASHLGACYAGTSETTTPKSPRFCASWAGCSGRGATTRRPKRSSIRG